MNVVYVAPFGLGQKTTVWARTLPLAQQVVACGHTASIIIPPWDTPQDAATQRTEQGVELVNVSLSGGIPAVVRRMLDETARRQPQIVHIIKPRAHAGLVHWWLRLRRRLGATTPHILLDVDDWEQAWAPINGYAWPVARVLAWQEEWGLRHADAVTAASQWLVAQVERRNPAAPLLYLPNGVTISATDALPRAPATSRPIVLFYTRFVEVDPQWLAGMWSALHTARPAARCLIAGAAFRPGQAAAYRAAVERHAPQAATAIDWLGFVTPAQQTQLYAAATVAIFPAQPVPLQQAKCSVRLATTLLNGVPVVASAVGEQSAYGADGAALLVDAGASPAQFAAAVVAMLDQPDLRAAGIRQARGRLQERYNWPRLGAELVHFYEQIDARAR